MRWKLLITASLAAVLAGAGGSAGLLYLLTGRAGPTTERAGWLVLVALLLPLAAITYASIFVYRHTARRRRLQAAATALASLSLTLALYLAFALFTTCCEPPPQTPPAPAPGNVSWFKTARPTRLVPGPR